MPTKITAPRVYAACLSSYNAGILHGAWVGCDQDEDGIMDEIKAMIAASTTPGAEEWAFHDFENFQGVEVGENESAANLADLGLFLSECEFGGALIQALSGNNRVEQAQEALENYDGEFSSPEEWAEQTLTETEALKGLPEDLRVYFDFKAYARDAELSGNIFTVEVNGSVHIFRNC